MQLSDFMGKDMSRFQKYQNLTTDMKAATVNNPDLMIDADEEIMEQEAKELAEYQKKTMSTTKALPTET